MTRRAKPIEFHILDGNKNRLTKKQIKERENSKITLGTLDFVMPERVKKIKYAREKWNSLIDLFNESKFELVTTADVGVIERYCLTHAEYMHLQDIKQEIAKMYPDDLKKQYDQAEIKKLDAKINTKNNILTAMEDHLYLTPLSRIRSIVKKERKREEEDPLKKMGFDI